MEHLQDGTLLLGGRYRIVRFIGSGGFGCTYEAIHTELGERVAIKEFFVKDFCSREEGTSQIFVATQSKTALVDKLRNKFKDEAKVLYRLRHPGIVRVPDVFEENDTVYYVMDYIEGRSLQDILKDEGILSEKKALKYIRQVADALQYVHSQNCLHLDIKPGNIMVDKYDNAILIDFGASKQYDEENGENTSTLFGRTPGFAPPEQMANNVTTFFPATDIYALGSTLYKILSGKTPLDSLLRIAGEQLDPLPENISRRTSNAISKAMELNKNLRPQSVAEFLALLDGDPEETSKASMAVSDDSECSEPAKDAHPKDKLVKKQVHERKMGEKGEPVSGKSRRGGLVLAFSLVAGIAIGYAVFMMMSVREDISGISTSSSKVDTATVANIEYVDLGLSIKWSQYNAGASSRNESGDYYSMKEIREILSEKKDVLRVPSFAEMEELVERCEWEWVGRNGEEGYKVTGPNGNEIFLPEGCGYYWVAADSTDMESDVFSLYVSESSRSIYWLKDHDGKFPIRPVSN